MRQSAIILSVVLTAQLSAAVYYVSPAGKNKNPGTEAKPFKTIAFAAKKAAAGDTIKILPGLYRENVKLSIKGKENAPVTFEGVRDKEGKLLTVIEAPGTNPAEWTPAPEVGAKVWKTPVKRRPDGVLMDGKTIIYINSKTMALPRKNIRPAIFTQKDIMGKFGKKCTRIPGFDMLALPDDVRITGGQVKSRKEPFFSTIGNVMAGWHNGMLYVRFANNSTPQEHKFSAYCGDGFSCNGAEHLVFKNLHVRGSNMQFDIKNSRHITIDSCLLMNGAKRVFVQHDSSDVTIKNCILTSGFINSEHYASHGMDDKRGRVVYITFKYVVGLALSHDVGITVHGKNTTICDNVITDGLIGLQAIAPGVKVYNNAISRMASCGVVTGPTTNGEFHHNFISYCGILQRFHRLREKHFKRVEYHYKNFYLQKETLGTEMFIHCESQLVGDDMVNFEPGTKIYKKNPPKPVYPGDFYIYHNTFWGGNRYASVLNCENTAKRFGEPYPFCVFNNILRFSTKISDWQHVFDNNLLYAFTTAGTNAKYGDPAIVKRNRVLPFEERKNIWSNRSVNAIPDITLAKNSHALGVGIDVSKPFSYRGRDYSAMPGFKPGYFKGSAPAAGALQPGEGMEHYLMLAERLDSARKLIKNL
ncbi:MAG: right-handed parallel beta-helix repeat-containing protein [Lentisphaeria bacterium]|nr:right-handed parallel beta-helix repeat-containing protein [Lentisphaeria bacterium]